MASKTFKFKVLNFVSKKDVPVRAYPNSIQATGLDEDMNTLAAEIKKNGVVPFEEAAEINIKNLDLKGRDNKPLKRPTLTVHQWLRAFVKKQGLDKKLDIVTRADRIFLVGK